MRRQVRCLLTDARHDPAMPFVNKYVVVAFAHYPHHPLRVAVGFVHHRVTRNPRCNQRPKKSSDPEDSSTLKSRRKIFVSHMIKPAYYHCPGQNIYVGREDGARSRDFEATRLRCLTR